MVRDYYSIHYNLLIYVDMVTRLSYFLFTVDPSLKWDSVRITNQTQLLSHILCLPKISVVGVVG